eukprot:scaffold14615_cov65-Cyclotella_meneghiniana.AAC.5
MDVSFSLGRHGSEQGCLLSSVFGGEYHPSPIIAATSALRILTGPACHLCHTATHHSQQLTSKARQHKT